MSHIIIGGQKLPHYRELTVQNWDNDGLVRFVNQPRPHKVVTEVIVHETVTRTHEDTVAVLLQRQLGVHFIVGPDGIVYQHADLLDDMMWHASQHNGPSIGIEMVNPYYPRFMPSHGLWDRVIQAPWADGGQYVVPTHAQVEAVTQLVSWLTSADATGLTIPRAWAGVKGNMIAMGRVEEAAHTAPGIYAHHYFGHMDGAWPTLYAWLRLEGQREPQEAYQEAISLAFDATGPITIGEKTPTDPAPPPDAA